MTSRSRRLVEGDRREDGVERQIHPAAEDVHVLVLDPHVRAPEREAAEAARGDPDFAEDLRLGLVGDFVRRLRLLGFHGHCFFFNGCRTDSRKYGIRPIYRELTTPRTRRVVDFSTPGCLGHLKGSKEQGELAACKTLANRASTEG